MRLRFASENSRKKGPCGDDPMHGSCNNDGSMLENGNENKNGSMNLSCHHAYVYAHGYIMTFGAK